MIREKWIDRSEKAGFVKKMAPGELPPIGSRAVVLRSLRPMGEIRYEMQVFQAVCEGAFVDFGQPVEVIGHKENQVVVYRNRPQNWILATRKLSGLVYFMCLYISNIKAHKIDQSRRFGAVKIPILWAIPV